MRRRRSTSESGGGGGGNVQGMRTGFKNLGIQVERGKVGGGFEIFHGFRIVVEHGVGKKVFFREIVALL